MEKTPWTEKQQEILTYHKLNGLTAAEIAKKLHRSTAAVAKKLSRLRIANGDSRTQTNTRFEESGGTATASAIVRVNSLEALIEAAKIDLETWEVDRWVANKWEVASWATGEKEVSDLWQVKAWLKRHLASEKSLASLFSDIAAKRIKAPVFKAAKPKGDCLYEISIPDLHLGKLAWPPETGHAAWDSELAANAFRNAIVSLESKVDKSRIGEVLLPIGNDFFNVDNHQSQTTAGTPQDEDGRWQKSFTTGCALLTDVIADLAKRYRVKAIIVPGNHDYERSFYLGEYLAAWFRNHDGVSIDNSPVPRKYHRHGDTLIGFTHGNKIKPIQLLQLAPMEQRDYWAKIKYVEWHLGHLHHESAREECGTILRRLPSLTAPDEYHSSNGYVGNQRAAQGFLYAPEGLEQITYHRI